MHVDDENGGDVAPHEQHIRSHQWSFTIALIAMHNIGVLQPNLSVGGHHHCYHNIIDRSPIQLWAT
jgi:hypothetical protein